MEKYAFLLYVICFIVIIIVGKIFIFPLKKIMKMLVNSIVGSILIYITNFVGVGLNFHIGLNWWTILCTGILGIPGFILIILLKLLVS